MLHDSLQQREWEMVLSLLLSNISRSYSLHDILVGMTVTPNPLHFSQPESRRPTTIIIKLQSNNISHLCEMFKNSFFDCN
jgi:hypothetical protein